jgi:homoserine dehydrogenase
VLIEALGGVEPARTLVESALRRGIRVITANKALIAAHGPALLALARAHHTTIDFEGAVGAAIPVIRALRSGSVGADIVSVRGVLNGTTNAILDAVASGVSFDVALARAQSDGFAEADPSRDLDGRDAEDKLRVLAWLAFGMAPQSLTVDRRGLDRAVIRWARWVASRGGAVRLLATVEREGQHIRARIRPERVEPDGAWGQVRGANNRVEIVSRSAGTLTLDGAGAGGHATALALLADLQSPVRDQRCV